MFFSSFRHRLTPREEIQLPASLGRQRSLAGAAPLLGAGGEQHPDPDESVGGRRGGRGGQQFQARLRLNQLWARVLVAREEALGHRIAGRARVAWILNS